MGNLLINADDWESLSSKHRKEIVKILKKAGLISEDDKVIGDPDEPRVSVIAKELGMNFDLTSGGKSGDTKDQR